MHILSIKNVVKRYSNHTAVDHMNLDIPKGKIFGLLGPNGAGKTSLIRMITCITMVDEGEIYVDGQKLHNRHPQQIGYMPEERGLYKKMAVGEQLLYLARLKGLDTLTAKKNIKYWLDKFEIRDWYHKKVGELSKGMQQKVQFIATVLHDPKLIILDEPFSGLDPINTNLIKDEIYNLKKDGTSIIFSTHRMEQVEQICEDIALINQGKVILNGHVDSIKDTYKKGIFKIKASGDTLAFDPEYTTLLEHSDGFYRVQLHEGQSTSRLLSDLLKQDADIHHFEEILPSLNDIFIQKVGAQ